MSSAFLNGVTIRRGDGGDPTEVFTEIAGVVSLSGVGKTNSLVDVTSFDSAAREYISGLADGTEITMECNYLPADTEQQGLISDVDSGTNRNIEITVTDGTTPKVYTFATTPLSWELAPSYEDKNMINFALKISGDITVT